MDLLPARSPAPCSAAARFAQHMGLTVGAAHALTTRVGNRMRRRGILYTRMSHRRLQYPRQGVRICQGTLLLLLLLLLLLRRRRRRRGARSTMRRRSA